MLGTCPSISRVGLIMKETYKIVLTTRGADKLCETYMTNYFGPFGKLYGEKMGFWAIVHGGYSLVYQS